MNKNYLTVSLVLIITLLSGCLNTLPLTNFKANRNQTIPMKVTPVPVTAPKPAATVVVDWQKIEALADKRYQEDPLPDYYFDVLEDTELNSQPGFYARDFNVSISEAQRRLILVWISSSLIEAVAEQLGESLAAIYYDNNDPNEFSIKMTTLTTVEAVPPKYIYHFKQKEFEDYSLPIYIQATSDKSEQQILALQQKATPEIRRRYPEMQWIAFIPMTNTIRVMMYSKTADEAERVRIEAELTELVGHPVTVGFLENRITTL